MKKNTGHVTYWKKTRSIGKIYCYLMTRRGQRPYLWYCNTTLWIHPINIVVTLPLETNQLSGYLQPQRGEEWAAACSRLSSVPFITLLPFSRQLLRRCCLLLARQQWLTLVKLFVWFYSRRRLFVQEGGAGWNLSHVLLSGNSDRFSNHDKELFL